MALTPEQRRELRARGINPRFFDPRLSGAFQGFDFSGDFAQDLRSLNELYEGSQEIDLDSLTGEGGIDALVPTRGGNVDDYRSALDSLFMEYPDQATFQTNEGGRNLYMDVGIPYFRQGDETGYFEGSQLGDFASYHVNDDTDALKAITGNPLIQFAGNVATGGLYDYATGGEGGSLPWLDLAKDIATYQGPGSTSGDSPQDTGEYSSVFDPLEENIPGLPDMDLPGPGGIWDLIDIEFPGGGGVEDDVPRGTPDEVVAEDQRGEDYWRMIEWILDQQGDGNTPQDTPPEPQPEVEPAPEGPLDDPTVAPEEPVDQRGPDYWEMIQGVLDQGGWLPQDSPSLPPEDIPTGEDTGGIIPSEPGGVTDEPTVPGDPGGDDNPNFDFDFNLPTLPGGDDMADWTDWLPGVEGGIGIDWSNILNPDFQIQDLIGDIANDLTSNIDIDFGNLADALLSLGGAYAGWDQSQQDPQYPTIDDLYGGEYAGRMKNLRDQILGMRPRDMLADMNPDMRRAINQLTGLATGQGAKIAAQQGLQGRRGLSGLDRLGSYANWLQQSGGPEFEYDQDTFDQVMGNLMPGIEGTYVDRTRDMIRNLNENLLPGINQEAMGTGNMAGSRAGVAEGIATRGTQDRMADVESQLIQNAINQANQAGYGGGSQNLGANLQTQGDILGGYGSQAQLGLPGLASSYATTANAAGLGLDAAGVLQDYNQARLDRHRDLLGWQIPLMNMTTPAGAGGVGTPYTSPSWLTGTLEGIDMGAGLSEALQNVLNSWST